MPFILRIFFFFFKKKKKKKKKKKNFNLNFLILNIIK